MKLITKWSLAGIENFMQIVPQHMKYHLLRAIIRGERIQPPRESVRWLLGIHDLTAKMIDQQCIEWGNGIHIKHELMTGIHSFFYERIPHGVYVLDVGCGHGALAYAIVNHVDAHVIGVDFNENHLAYARNHFSHPKLCFERTDVMKEEIAYNRVDVVVLSSVIEHLPNRIELLHALIQKFQPQLFLIRVPTFERHHFTALKQELGIFAYTDPTHEIEYSPTSFRCEMEQAGLEINYMEVRWGDIWAECVPKMNCHQLANIQEHGNLK